MSYICNECRAALRSISALCTHLQTIHSFSVNIYTCAQDDCNREYDSIKSFRKHLRTRHLIRPHLRVKVMENAPLAENVIGINRDNVPINTYRQRAYKYL